MNKVGNDNFLLDSGAFSFMNGAKNNDLNDYINRYIAFINKYNIKYFFELDLYTIVGIEKTEEIRNRMEKEIGRKCIPVWHKMLGVDYWKSLISNYDYIAIGGIANNTIKKSEYHLIKKLLNMAACKGVKVHGLGFTKTKILHEFNFYSVDSTSWLSGSVRGQQLYTFKGNYMVNRPLNNKGRKVYLDKLSNHNLNEWIKYQLFMDSVR